MHKDNSETRSTNNTTRFRHSEGSTKVIINIFLGAIPVSGIVYLTDVCAYCGLVIYREQYLGVFLALVLVSSFLTVPASQKCPRDTLPWYDILLAICSALVGGYVALLYPQLIPRLGYISAPNVILGIVTILLVLEATRRLLGYVLTGVGLFFILYAAFAYLLPGILHTRHILFERLAIYLYLEPGSLLGTPFFIAGTIVLGFILFGRCLFSVGGGQFLSDLAMAALGKYRGGPAKGAIIASALFGSLSGSASANVATTGMVTIPLMKRVGYSPVFAGAVETVASTGGLLLPPVMGATAFIMAEFLEIPYAEVAAAAAVPAILYYFSVYIQLHLRAVNKNIKGLPPESLPSFKKVVSKGWPFVLPLLALVYLMFGLNLRPESCAIYSSAFVLLVGLTRKENRSLGKLAAILPRVGQAILEVAVICAMAGFIVGSLAITGLGLKLSNLIVTISGGELSIILGLAAASSIILGMGMPLIATYIMLVIVIAPALVKVGVVPLAAHLFIMYFGAMSFLTPPVCIAAYVAAGIANANPMKTGFQSLPLAVVAFIIPFVFVYSPTLLSMGTVSDITLAILSSVGGIVMLAIAFEGYLFKRINIAERVLSAAGGVLLFIPNPIFRIVGFLLSVLLVLISYLQYFMRKRKLNMIG